jgi:hypothetical protein
MSRPGGHEATKQDLKCDASTLAFHEILKESMAEKEEVNAKRDVKRLGEKDATCANSLTSKREILKLKRAMPNQKPLRPRPSSH